MLLKAASFDAGKQLEAVWFLQHCLVRLAPPDEAIMDAGATQGVISSRRAAEQLRDPESL